MKKVKGAVKSVGAAAKKAGEKVPAPSSAESASPAAKVSSGRRGFRGLKMLLPAVSKAVSKASRGRAGMEEREPAAMKKGGMADKYGRAMKKTAADARGRAMKKGK